VSGARERDQSLGASLPTDDLLPKSFFSFLSSSSLLLFFSLLKKKKKKRTGVLSIVCRRQRK
jgi:hypothetical protein